MNIFLKHKLIVAVLLAFVGAGLNLVQGQTRTKVVVIPLSDDAKFEPFAPVAPTSPPDINYTIGTTAVDNITGLEWQRIDDNNFKTWGHAGSYCMDLSLESKDNWRLPSISELMSIVSYSASSPVINGTAFPTTDALPYWSASGHALQTSAAWTVDFDDGSISFNSKTVAGAYVYCVRSNRTNGPLFQDNKNGTVMDLATRLTWQQEDDNNTKNWAEARNYCSSLVLGNKSNWRLPNVKELASIVDYRVVGPAIDEAMFPSTSTFNYWSTTRKGSRILAPNAWAVHFSDGWVGDGSKTTSYYYVRCVR